MIPRVAVTIRRVIFLSEAIFNRESDKALKIVNDFAFGGGSYELLASSLQEHLRNLLFARVAPEVGELFEVSDRDLEKYKEQAQDFEESDLLRAINLFAELETALRRKTSEPRLATEITVMKAVNLDRTVKIDRILKQLSSQPRPLSLETSVDQAQMDLMAAEQHKETPAEKSTAESVQDKPAKKEEPEKQKDDSCVPPLIPSSYPCPSPDSTSVLHQEQGSRLIQSS